jgi:hypothetical protein
MKEKRDQPDEYVSLEEEKVIWHNADLVFSTFDLNKVVVIGEYTNSNGPWFDDWFITFVLYDGSWQSIPWYVTNIDKLTKVLSDKFQTDLSQSYLVNSAQWKSLIRYPVELKGLPLFSIISYDNGCLHRTIWTRIINAVGFGKSKLKKQIELTVEVKTLLLNVRR